MSEANLSYVRWQYARGDRLGGGGSIDDLGHEQQINQVVFISLATEFTATID